jgi:hypothetical protein
VDTFADHGGTSGEQGGNEFDDSHERIADERRYDYPFRTGGHYF